MTEQIKTTEEKQIEKEKPVSPENHEKQLKEMTEKVKKIEGKIKEKKSEGDSKEQWKGERGKGLSKEDREAEDRERRLNAWIPKTQLGRDVNTGKIKNIQEIFDSGRKILEPEIVDKLLNLKSELLNVGQAKGKFGGGQRRPWRQTQKKTQEGNVVTFSVLAVVGDGNGYVGVGYGRSKETLPAREKAVRKAKLNIQKIERGCGSYDCSCDEWHSIPFKVKGKCSAAQVNLMPAPQGTGIVACDELKKILKLAGIKDIYTKTIGSTRTTINLSKACMHALNKLGGIRL